MLLRKYRLPVKQHVLFLGKGKPRMPVAITEDEFHFRYNMLNMSEVDFRVFLRSPHPEEKVLAILANFGTGGTVQALSHIIRDIHESVPDDLAKARYFRQLRVLAQLRNLNIKITEIMGDISSYFSDDKDILYRLGQERGREQGIEQGMETARQVEKELFVLNLLQHTDFSDDRIATLAAVDTGFVRERRKRLKAGHS